MPNIDYEGDFRGRLIGWGFNESTKSSSVGIDLQMMALECFNQANNSWEDISAQQYTTRGTVWIIKTDGQPNEEAIQRFMKASGWSGNPDQILGNAPWEPLDFAFSVVGETYEGKTRFKINWINPWEFTPGGVRQMNQEQAVALKNRIGSQLRAVASNAARNAPKHAPRPAVPPPAAAPQAAPPFVPDEVPSSTPSSQVPW